MKVKKQKFGVLSDGTKVSLFTVKNDHMSFSCSDYGCTLTSIVLKNKNNINTDILLGFSTLEGYINTKLCFGTIVGRFANRIGNGSFSLNGTNYKLDKNDGENTLHGGYFGYDKIVWDSEIIEEKDKCGVRFSHFSPDGEQGFPGNLMIYITYTLDNDNNINCYYTAETDAPTPINITNHSYFNLSGRGSVYKHLLTLKSNKVLEIDSDMIPTGKFLDVVNSPFDFTVEKEIGKDIDLVSPGYDHCFTTDIYDIDNKQCGVPLDYDNIVPFATVRDPVSNCVMNVSTNMEGFQFYTANWIKGVHGKNGVIYNNHDGFCLETQCFPDSPNKINFPTCVLEPGQKMKARTVFSFKYL